MKDRFENFIKDHRESFDFREPDPRLWENLKKSIPAQRSLPWRLFLKRASIVILIFGASYIANEMIHRYSKNGISFSKQGKESPIPGLNEAEAYYTNLINQKLDELKPVLANCPSLQEEIDYDLSGLDSVYTELKSDLKDNMANQEVIEAIIQNYKLKITILEDIMSELAPLEDECIQNSDEYAI
jgi:hypothetical protein